MTQIVLSAFNRTRGTALCLRLDLASGLRDRSRGLIGRPALARDLGLLFERGRCEPFMWFHTMLMTFPIDIVFLDSDGTVLAVNHDLGPWRVSSLVLRARKAIELPSGRVRETGTQTGDIIVFEPPRSA